MQLRHLMPRERLQEPSRQFTEDGQIAVLVDRNGGTALD
jgi:hypothetical protein